MCRQVDTLNQEAFEGPSNGERSHDWRMEGPTTGRRDSEQGPLQKRKESHPEDCEELVPCGKQYGAL